MEVPLTEFGLRWFRQRHHSRRTRVEVLHEALDGATLTGGVTPLEQDHVLGAAVPCPVLEFQQLDLQLVLLGFVLIAFHPLLVGIVLPPGLDRVATGIDQIRVRTVLVMPHGVPAMQQVVQVLAEVLADQHMASIDPSAGHQVTRR